MIMDFVDENYNDFKVILSSELKGYSNISAEFYDNLVLRLLPEFQKVKSKDEIARIIRVELLNELRQDELPKPEKISDFRRNCLSTTRRSIRTNEVRN
jgi:hypothetical protein